MSRKRLALVSGTFLFLALASGVWAGFLLVIPTTGTIKAVGLKADPETISWGIIPQNGAKTRSVLLTSESNVAVTLNMTVSGLPSYLSLSWNREDYQLVPAQSVDAEFTLTASNAPGGASFNFDIIINLV